MTVQVTNRGYRDGKEVVQVYVERPDSAVDRPVRWLVGSTPVRVPAGQTTRVDVAVPTKYLAYWAEGWKYEPGDFRLRIGTTAGDPPLETTLRLPL